MMVLVLGMFVIDTKTKEKANQLMEEIQNSNLGYLKAVSLGFYKTLFSNLDFLLHLRYLKMKERKWVYLMV